MTRKRSWQVNLPKRSGTENETHHALLVGRRSTQVVVSESNQAALHHPLHQRDKHAIYGCWMRRTRHFPRAVDSKNPPASSLVFRTSGVPRPTASPAATKTSTVKSRGKAAGASTFTQPVADTDASSALRIGPPWRSVSERPWPWQGSSTAQCLYLIHIIKSTQPHTDAHTHGGGARATYPSTPPPTTTRPRPLRSRPPPHSNHQHHHFTIIIIIIIIIISTISTTITIIRRIIITITIIPSPSFHHHRHHHRHHRRYVRPEFLSLLFRFALLAHVVYSAELGRLLRHSVKT